MFSIEHPIIQGGMDYVGSPNWPGAVSNAGGLGIIAGLTQRTPKRVHRCQMRMTSPASRCFGSVSVPACGGCQCVGRKCRVADTGVAPNTLRISLEKDADGARRHSDKVKFRSDLNRPESCKKSEGLLETLRKFADFQAEYDGSIPVTCLEPGVTIATWLPWELLNQTIAITCGAQRPGYAGVRPWDHDTVLPKNAATKSQRIG